MAGNKTTERQLRIGAQARLRWRSRRGTEAQRSATEAGRVRLHITCQFAIERRYPSLKSDLADNGELRHCDVGLRTIFLPGTLDAPNEHRRLGGGRVGCAYYERRSELQLCTIPFPPLCTAQIQAAA